MGLYSEFNFCVLVVVVLFVKRNLGKCLVQPSSW